MIEVSKSKVRKNTYAMRYVAGQPAERILPPGSFASIGQALPPGEPLSTEERIRILVWNIYKQQRAEWLSVLKNYGKDAHLVLLQEAQTTPELVQFATANYLAADQVPAFVLPQHPSGVMTLSAAHPVYCCPLREREPILRLAKSALVTVYPLPDTRLLMVVNIHAVNFSLGVDVYSKQLLPIGDQIAHHSGPVIMAGDFNAWYWRGVALFDERQPVAAVVPDGSATSLLRSQRDDYRSDQSRPYAGSARASAFF